MNRPLLSALLAVLSLAACGRSVQPAPGELATSAKQRITAAAPQDELDKTLAGNTDFAADLYRDLAAKNENLAFSPYSISTALAMTYAGARGDTQTAFEKTMHITLAPDAFHRSMNTVDLALASRGVGAQGKDGKPFRLVANNQLFSQKGYSLQADFLDTLAAEYGAGVRLLDFQGAPEPSRKSINAWVENNTEGLIPELLGQGSISSDTRLTLVNTLYFNASWQTKFDHNSTRDGEFTLLDGTKKQVPMMASEDISGSQAVVDGVDVLSLPYDGGEVSMVLLVPPVGKLADFEAQLSASKLATLVAALKPGTVAVRMPKFEVRTQSPLNETLQKLGLGIAFGGGADFSGMTGTRELSITDVIHEAVVKTDEDGTVAAAATAVVMGRVSMPSYIEVNRPFLFLIRDQTGAVAFMGRIVNP
ncbi:MAG: serpin family protein [Myxococcaceae bacterium]